MEDNFSKTSSCSACTRNAYKYWLIVLAVIAVVSVEIYLSPSRRSASYLVALSKKSFVVDFFNQNINDSAPATDFQPKFILLWTPFFSDIKWKSHIEELGGKTIRLTKPGFQNKSCQLTSGRHHLLHASAVIFHGRNFYFNDLPKFRTPNQRWVFYLLESPHHSGFDDRAWHQANKLGFNWTVYYTYASDSRFAYGYVNSVNYSEPEITVVNERISMFARNFSSRPFDGVWFVSNCAASSGREVIIKKFEDAGLKMDLWGKCYQRKPDDELKSIGEQAFFSRYRFQMAMENSICDDYATEKLFNAARNSERYGVIPVVLGGANYSKIMAPGSFIDARLPVEDVIRLMKRLSLSDQAETVRKYFEWQTRFEVEKRPFTVPGWEAMCEKLWDPSEPSKIVNDLRQPLGRCHE